MKILAVSYPPNKKDMRKLKFFCDKYDQLQRAVVQEENDAIKLKEPSFDGLETSSAGICK